MAGIEIGSPTPLVASGYTPFGNGGFTSTAENEKPGLKKLPLWLWGVIIVGGFLLWRKVRK